MHDHVRPSTSAENANDEECYFDNSQRCKLCEQADHQIAVGNVKQMKIQRKYLPPDRQFYSSFFIFLTLFLNILAVEGFSHSFSHPVSKLTVREYDENGVGTVRFSPLANGRPAQLQRMASVYDKNTNRLVVGAVNHLYDVSTSLADVKEDVVIGPVDSCDSRNCDVYIKVLTIDTTEHALVECSSANDGTCRRRILGNISNVVEESERKMVPYTQESVATALITDTCGMNNFCDKQNVKTLFLGATPIQRPENVYMVAGYNMTRGSKFSLIASDFETLSLPFNTQLKIYDSKIDYIASFEYQNYVYFIMKQNFDNTNSTSKLARMCKSDGRSYSYSEIPLECTTKNGERLPYVQDAYLSMPQYSLASEFKESSIDNQYFFAVFSTGYHVQDSNNATSGICIFKMKDIVDQFHQAHKDCNAGNGTQGFVYFPSATPKQCSLTGLVKYECGTEVNPYVNGHNYPVVSRSVFDSRTDFFTSIFIHGVQDVNVAFVGTSKGKLHKIVIHNSTTASIFKTLDLGSSAILQDKVFVPETFNLFVLSEHGVHKIKLDHCESVDGCNQCLNQGNPFCGWCLVTNKCSKATECHEDMTFRNFISYKHKDNCPTISEINPKQQYIATSTTLKIKAQNLHPNNSLKCVFEIGTHSHDTEIFEKDGILQCSTPTFSSLQDAGILDFDVSHVVAKLSITTNKRRTLVSTNITFFDCQQHKNCFDCANSTYPCNWCISASKCVANPEDSCLRDKLVVSKQIQQPATLKGPYSCPRIDTMNHTNFYIGAGRSRQIAVQALNLDANMQFFKCNFSYGNHFRKTVPANKIKDHIECQDIKFDSFERHYSSSGGQSTLPIDLKILWSSTEKSGQHGLELAHYNVLDNPHDIKVIVYMCEKLANNCGKCLTLSKHYECGWCEESQRCTFRSTCEKDWTSIMTANARCKRPQILDFWPKKGPIEGNTRLNITGINLGLSAEHLKVTVGSYKCNVVDYKPTESILCNTRGPKTPMAGEIVVSVVTDTGTESQSEYTVTAGDFRFADPEIERFYPSKGPVSGGTDVTIIGNNLDSGREVSVRIGNVNCNLRERTEKFLICRTEKANAPGEKGDIVLNVDGISFKRRNIISFEFREDPIVTRVKHAVSIVDGGIFVDVFGRDFDLLQRPRMVVRYEDELHYSNEICQRVNNTFMLCRTPAIPVKKHLYFSNDQPLFLHFGFSLDGEEGSIQEYTTLDEELKLKVYPNPQVSSIGNFQTDQTGSDLVLRGSDLNVAANVRDVNITVGGVPCIVTALASVTLTCQMKEEHEYILSSSDPLDVVVKIGNHLVEVGTVSNGLGSSSYLIPAVISAAVFLFLLIIFFVLYRKKNTSHNRQLRTLKHQMTTIEMKVAQECKEAFHELQTNLNAIAGSLPDGTSFIPFLSYQDYTARILFPHSFNNHPVLRELEVDQDRAHQVESGLRQLHHLINNRTFLLSFVRTIDENKYLLQKDRVYVGSLLMVILQERMDYCTDILKQLLKDLIRRNLEARFQPKILFRRAESVAERMLSVWFSFLMYRYLTTSAGEQLYQLYWATKQQTEKGPQDAITLEARYSLSEEKLLRSTVQSRELTVFVISEGSGVIADTQVTVLDCDSISQVKEKCIDAKYRTIPYSGRPTISDVDLELRLPTGGRKLLLDLDQSSKHENGYWKQNTLAHYGIDNKAMLALVPRQTNSSSYNLSLLSDRSDKSSVSFHNSPTLTRPFGTTSSNGKDTMRVYHLVRQQGEQDPQEKMMSEIYLTRLLHMKGILQRFIENLFEIIFTTSNGPVRLPVCVKYMFDFLDDQAREHGIMDEDVVHAWKSNALPLRFWVNLIKNPDFIFDIPKPTKIEGSLNVVAQTLMDACSTQELHLTKDSPSSKLLFANDMDKYKNLVHSYYDDISKLTRIPDAEMNSFLLREYQNYPKNFTVYSSALNELYVYIAQNRDMIFEELSKNEYALHEALPEKFQKMLDTMDIMPENALINNGSLELNYNSKSRLMSSANSRFY
uniref:Sema domain-containing protein n=1 Tax=Panagrolaimus sp. JU765 TaxID=591449 RepID=A0AC34RQY4_9BILA